MSLDEAVAELGNEDYEVRQQAEKVIRMADISQYDRIQEIAGSGDPEIATRARRSLPIVLLEIDADMPQRLADKLRYIDDFSGRRLVDIVSELASLNPPRPISLIGLHSHLLTRRDGDPSINARVAGIIAKAMPGALRENGTLADLIDLRPKLYQTATLALVLNAYCRTRLGDWEPLLPLRDSWTEVHPQLPSLLDRDGYRLELTRMMSETPDRTGQLRKLLEYATSGELSKIQLDSIVRQLAGYRDEAATFPVDSLDQATGWYFFKTLGTITNHLDAYIEYRKRFPKIDHASLMGQPFEVLLVLKNSGPKEAMNCVLAQKTNDGVSYLAEYLHSHPELIREPLPLQDLGPKQSEYPYRPLKFMRVFAPYATQEELDKFPEIAAAVKILTQDPRWLEVAKQSRAIIAKKRAGDK